MTESPSTICPVILAGGSGTRLWPLSRAGFPKQFLCLQGEHSLFQQTARRLAGLGSGPDALELLPALVVGNEEHRFLVLEQMREIGAPPGRVLLEPMGRNTAPALALAALAAMEPGEDPVLVVTPADHVVSDEAAFHAALRTAVAQAADGQIVILGVTPTRPETGFGYIHARGARPDAAVPVQRFVEKPDAATARRYLAEGDYLWNAGMFVLRASVWLAALERFRPDIAAASRVAWAARSAADTQFIRPGKAEFAAIPADSIDYAVMERCPGSEFAIEVVPLDAGWSDLGAWDAVWDALPKDDHGNATRGDVLSVGSRDNLVHASGRLVGLVGVKDLVVVDTPDALLVASRGHAQDVKHIVAQLQRQQRGEHHLHRKVHRPWGWYDSIDEAERFKVKRIQVKPRASLSLQMHYHRAEHWVVVKGTAEITCGDKVVILTENQSTYIPLGEVHRLSNPGTIPLELIEVQSGSYLGEDDIVRFEDRYGR